MKSDDQRNDAVETYPEKPICMFLKAVGAVAQRESYQKAVSFVCDFRWTDLSVSKFCIS